MFVIALSIERFGYNKIIAGNNFKDITTMKSLFTFLFLATATCAAHADSKMTQSSLEKIVKSIASVSKGKNGVVAFRYKNVNLYLISDVRYNRMRIVAPIVKYSTLNRKQLDAVLYSNFHQSLDARYAVSNGILYSAYIHPLSDLSASQVRSAVKQVTNLAVSFGGTYSSGVLKFGGQKKKPEGLSL